MVALDLLAILLVLWLGLGFIFLARRTWHLVVGVCLMLGATILFALRWAL